MLLADAVHQVGVVHDVGDEAFNIIDPCIVFLSGGRRLTRNGLLYRRRINA
jgi:hypothetical protein